MDTTATETIDPAIAPEVEKKEEEEVEKTSLPDHEARIAELEKEKAKVLEEASNYKLAYLKEKNKHKDEPVDEDEDDRIRRIASETMANSRIAEIMREQDQIIKQALKEN